MRALAHLAWEEGVPDCTRCVHDDGLRVEYGCGEAQAPKVLYSVTCSACGGGGCGRCDRGQVRMRRCPRKLCDRHQDIERAFWAFTYFDSHGVLPAAGGLADQSAALLELWDAARAERGSIEREREKIEKAKRERLAKIEANRGR